MYGFQHGALEHTEQKVECGNCIEEEFIQITDIIKSIFNCL